MNKNLLLIAAAAAAYALLRPKTTAATNPSSAQAGAGVNPNTYTQQYAAQQPAAAGGGWLNTATGLITGATAIIQTGSTAWGDVKDALHIKPPVTPASAPASVPVGPGEYQGIWAGHVNYSTEEY